jgi:hypothetical protein
MYIGDIEITDFRCFSKAKISLLHSGRNFKALDMPRPRAPNVNIVLGDNGKGKTALLMAIGLSCLGPAIGSSGIYPFYFVRRPPGENSKNPPVVASISATFSPHEQDRMPLDDMLSSRVEITRRGDLEEMSWGLQNEKYWHPIFLEESEAFFFVGYGAGRRVERRERTDIGSRKTSSFIRAQRIMSLFEDDFPLVPLDSWLPQLSSSDRDRYLEVIGLINRSLRKTNVEILEKSNKKTEMAYLSRGRKVPFRALSDGFRAYLGWIGDLLYHLHIASRRGLQLVRNRGIVMVDEIDLHLHPKWQMSAVTDIAKELPCLQFIVTSHSPLVVGSLQWMNMIVMRNARDYSTSPRRIPHAIHGLDADQVLLTEFFGLRSTRAKSKERRLKSLSIRARTGDQRAAEELLEEMSSGTEESE